MSLLWSGKNCFDRLYEHKGESTILFKKNAGVCIWPQASSIFPFPELPLPWYSSDDDFITVAHCRDIQRVGISCLPVYVCVFHGHISDTNQDRPLQVTVAQISGEKYRSWPKWLASHRLFGGRHHFKNFLLLLDMLTVLMYDRTQWRFLPVIPSIRVW